MTIYVLEGPDLAGKSTLALALQNQLTDVSTTVDVRRNGPPKGDTSPFATYISQIAFAHRQVTERDAGIEHVIFDRLHVGEFVYGPVLRDQSLITRRQAYAIDEYLDQIGAVRVFVTAPITEIMLRLGKRGDDLVDGAQLRRVIAGYETYMIDAENHGTPWIEWDTTQQGRVFQ